MTGRTIRIDFRENQKRLFNPLFYKLQDCTTRYVINYGGSGSGKSVSQHQLELMNLLDNPEHDTLFIRKYGTDIYDSCYMLLENIAKDWGVYNIFTWTYSNGKRQIRHPNGKRIIFKGIDDSEKIKSITGIKRIVIEEASQLERKDFLELIRRARGIKGIQIILLFNPIDENHWIKKLFFDEDTYKDKTTVFHTTYLDNKFLTEEDKEVLESLKSVSLYDYEVYALGKWGVYDNSLPWLYAFELSKHTKQRLPFMPSLPVYLSFDFNRDPITCIAAQMSHTKGTPSSFLHIIREFGGCIQLEELCTQIRSAYPASILYVTGDSSGNKGDSAYKSRHDTAYTLIQSYLVLGRRQMQPNKKNLEYEDSRLLMNVMMNNYPNFFIDLNACPNLVNDCRIARVDEESKKPHQLKKDRAVYKMDYFDGLRYLMQMYFNEFAKIKYLRYKSQGREAA